MKSMATSYNTLSIDSAMYGQGRYMVDITSDMVYKAPSQRKQTLTIGEGGTLPPSPMAKLMTETREGIRDLVGILKEHGVPVVSIEVKWNPHLGAYIMMIVDADARQALDLWLRLLDRPLRLEAPLFVMWTGRIDVSPEEMGGFVGKALAKMGLFPSTVEPIDAVRMLRDEWGLQT